MRRARRHRLCDARALRAQSTRGPACADLLVAAGPARVVVALRDPDPRTNGAGLARLEAAGIAVETGLGAPRRRRIRSPAILSRGQARPAVRHAQARHVDRRQDRHRVRREPLDHRRGGARPCPSRARPRRHDPGRPRHLEADRPRLDVRIAGLEDRSPRRALLTRGKARRRLDDARRPAGRVRAWATSTICWSRAAPADRDRLPRRRSGRPPADLPRADPDRRRPAAIGDDRPRKPRRRPWPLAARRDPRCLASTGSKSTSACDEHRQEKC